MKQIWRQQSSNSSRSLATALHEVFPPTTITNQPGSYLKRPPSKFKSWLMIARSLIAHTSLAHKCVCSAIISRVIALPKYKNIKKVSTFPKLCLVCFVTPLHIGPVARIWVICVFSNNFLMPPVVKKNISLLNCSNIVRQGTRSRVARVLLRSLWVWSVQWCS